MRKGRKPLAAGHVDGLAGSDLAKLRMSLILKAMLGEVTVPEASAQLGIGASRFHAMRNRWLQESLELLEPRPMGRPAKRETSGPSADVAQLRAENKLLHDQLQAAEVRHTIAEILKPVTPGADVAREKNRTLATVATQSRRRVPR